ncbi:CRISPR-associated protein Csx16 [Vibrio sinaloensis]|uniref:CRISPR-associated protein Csx16 n=1 Tax=Photobacterium sp. (strain ATCC 43367) TaxID=379097 RepID=UPI0035E90D8D
MRWFVSRHPGAKQWAKTQLIEVDQFVSHLDISQVEMGDFVIGTLPVHLAEQVCRRGARYFHLSLNLPPELRGQELNANTMQELQAQVSEYVIHRV